MRIWTIALALSAGMTVQAATVPPPRFTDPGRRAKLATAFDDIDRIFRGFAERTHVPGAAWGIIVDGELAHAGVFGYRDVATRAPVDADTVFRIASMTKSFTAMSILKLRDEGKLSLDDLAERYVPELNALKYPTTDSPRITLRHLLSHSEGFPEDNPWGDRQLSRSDDEMAAMMRAGIPFSNAPGVAYEYSNYGFAILGRIVSRVSGKPYDAYVAENILVPLGMTSTTLYPDRVDRNRLALGYRWEDERWKEEPLLPHGSFGAMGGMLTTVRDLARYVGAFLSAWPPRDGAETLPIRRASLREMQQAWRSSGARVARDPSSGAPQLTAGAYGFGLSVTETCDFHAMIAHGGGLPGFGSTMRWLPEYGVGVIAFGNLTYTGWTPAATEAFNRFARTGGLEPRVIEPSPALVEARDAVSKLLIAWDDRLADRVAADNLFLDRTTERRRAEMETLRARVGVCSPPDRFDVVQNALRGLWTLTCERGRLQVSVTLAPTMPPTVQLMEVRPAPSETRPPATCSQ